MEFEGNAMRAPMPLMALNHVSFVCRSVSQSVKFYEEVLGFVSIKRPSSFNFQGAWLFNHGVGIHLLQCNSIEDLPEKKGVINPKDNHISFQCSNMQLLKQNLKKMNIEYVTAIVEEVGIQVDQLFFHDPDGYMIEICTCDNLPVLPLASCPSKFTNYTKDDLMSESPNGKDNSKYRCSAEVADVILENLVKNMMHISF